MDNQNFYDATVYAVWQADRRRLGVVNGKSNADFTSNWYGPELTFEIELLAGGRHRADRLSVSPGDRLIVEITAALDRIRVYKRGGSAVP